MTEMVDLDVEELSTIAVDVYYGNHGAFLRAFADAWLKADPVNKEILRPSWTVFIKKYNLEAKAEDRLWEGSESNPKNRPVKPEEAKG